MQTPYNIKGDLNKGYTSSHNLRDSAVLAEPEVIYKDLVLYCELYRDPESGSLQLHIACPKCGNNLIVDQKKKNFSWENGMLNVDPFKCTWEAIGDRRVQFGVGLCRWNVGIKNNKAIDANK